MTMQLMTPTTNISDFYLLVIDDPVYWLSLAIAGFLLSFITVIANFILLATIYRDPHKSLGTPPCLLIANLSFSDYLVGLCVVSLVAFRDVYRSIDRLVPLPMAVGIFASYVLCTTLFVSSGTMVALSTSCFVAINNPMEYKTKITRTRIWIFIVIIWVISLLMCFLPATNISENTYLLIYCHTHVSLPAVLLIVIYFKGFRTLARRTRELSIEVHASVENSRRALERQRNMAVTILIILAMFFVTYIPQFTLVHIQFFCDSYKFNEESITFHKIDVVASRFVFLNSAVNPFIYAWRMSTYRRALRECWKRFTNRFCFCKNPRIQALHSFLNKRSVVVRANTT